MSSTPSTAPNAEIDLSQAFTEYGTATRKKKEHHSSIQRSAHCYCQHRQALAVATRRRSTTKSFLRVLRSASESAAGSPIAAAAAHKPASPSTTATMARSSAACAAAGSRRLQNANRWRALSNIARFTVASRAVMLKMRQRYASWSCWGGSRLEPRSPPGIWEYRPGRGHARFPAKLWPQLLALSKIQNLGLCDLET